MIKKYLKWLNFLNSSLRLLSLLSIMSKLELYIHLSTVTHGTIASQKRPYGRYTLHQMGGGGLFKVAIL